MNYFSKKLAATLSAATLMVIGFMSPAVALTEADVVNIINARVIQLQADAAAAQAVVNNPASTAAQIVEAQALLQFALARINQSGAVIAVINLPGTLPGPALDNIAGFYADPNSPA